MGSVHRLLDAKRCWVFAPALLGPALGGAAGAVFGGLCGLAYALLSAQPTPVVFCAARVALAGAAAGLLLGLFRTFERNQEWDWQRHECPPRREAADGTGAPAARARADAAPTPGTDLLLRLGGKASPRSY
jgi:hypothetical protein